jgi:hypothetical protein
MLCLVIHNQDPFDNFQNTQQTTQVYSPQKKHQTFFFFLIFRNKTPVHYAAKAGNLKTLQLLIEKGALSGILKSG